MDFLAQYLLRIISAAMILGILTGIMDKKSSSGALVRLIGGIFLALVMLQPLIRFDWSVITAFARDYTVDAQTAAVEGENVAQKEYRAIIKAETEAYILDKARSYGQELTVEVTLSNEDPPVPEGVCIQGNISPYAKSMLKKCLQEDLMIREEDQLWIG